MNGPCPSGDELERLLANQLSTAEEEALEAHVSGCDDCQSRLDTLTSSALTLPTVIPGGKPGGSAEAQGGGVLFRLANAQGAFPNDSDNGRAVPASHSNSSARRFGRSAVLTNSGRFFRRQIWTWPLIAAAVLGGIGWWVGRAVETAMRQQQIDELKTVLDADVTALDGWMDNQRVTAELVATDQGLQSIVRELLTAAEGAADARHDLIQSDTQRKLRARLAQPLRLGDFVGFVLISSGGFVLAADDDAAVGSVISGYRLDFFSRVISGEAAVSRPFLSPLAWPDENGELRADQPCMYAAVPIHGEDGRPMAALGLRIRPEEHFTRILQVARSGRTGETYAFDRQGGLLSESRFDDELKRIGLLVDRPGSKSILNVELRDPDVDMTTGARPGSRREDQRLTRMAEQAVLGADGYDVDGYRDYRGVPVIGAWRWLADYDLGVATEIDLQEAYAPGRTLRQAFALLMGLLLASAGAIFLAMLLIARQRRELHLAAVAAQKLGQYSLLEKLGAGGMGTVYRARHALLQRPTAVKLLNPDAMSDTAVARFEREVQLTSGLTHPNTVAIYDFGRTPEGVFYYAMEYLDGIDLEQLVNRHGPLPEARAVFILRQICASLGEAHAAGLVHRDVKPANVFLTCRGGQYDFVKVLDFGLVKSARDNTEVGLTATRIVAGTPLYVSPEVVTQADRIDARADVYAIGAVGYFLLTGSPVFTGSSATDICVMHVIANPVPPSVRGGCAVSPELEALLLRCLAKSPDDRPLDGTELWQLLDACPLSGGWTALDASRWWRECGEMGRGAMRNAAPAPV